MPLDKAPGRLSEVANNLRLWVFSSITSPFCALRMASIEQDTGGFSSEGEEREAEEGATTELAVELSSGPSCCAAFRPPGSTRVVLVSKS